MAIAKIQMPDGIAIEVDGTPAEVAAILADLKAARGPAPKEPRPSQPLRVGRGEIPTLIETLKSEEFFKTPRGLAEVQAKLGDLGHHYPVTTLSGAMQAQAKTRKLRRFKQGGRFVYVQ